MVAGISRDEIRILLRTRRKGLKCKMDKISDKIIGVAVAFLILTALVPSALDDFVAVDTTAWVAAIPALGTVWNLVPVLAIIGVAYLFWRNMKGAKN